MKIHFLLSLIVCCTFSISAHCQKIHDIKGQVKDFWGKEIPDVEIRANKSKNTATTDSLGYYRMQISSKDKSLKFSIPYTNPGVLDIRSADLSKELNFSIGLDLTTLDNGFLSENLKTYYIGSKDLYFKDVIAKNFPASRCDSATGALYVRQNDRPCAYFELDGSVVSGLDAVDPQSLTSITILRDMAECIQYGGKAQWGAVIMVSKGFNKAPQKFYNSKSAKPKRNKK